MARNTLAAGNQNRLVGRYARSFHELASYLQAGFFACSFALAKAQYFRLLHFLHMKTPFLAALLLLAAPTLLLAQTTTAKVKTKTPVGATTKTKTTLPAAPTQPKATPPEAQVEARANALTSNMQKALALNPDQVEKVRQINLVSVRGVESARLNYRQDVRKMAAVIDDIGQARLATLKNVLSPTQFDKYQRKREEKMGVPSSQGAQGNPAPGLPGGE
jgi:hypothetical protein